MSKEIPVYSGPDSVKSAPKGRFIEYEYEEIQKRAFITWPEQYRRKYREMRSPTDGHLLTDAEIDLLIRSVQHGFKEDEYQSTEQFIEFLKYRNEIPEKIYGNYESDIAVCRFFESGHGEKKENILADIRKLNEEQHMGNVKIPNTDIEIINYSPCPKCGHIHSFADVFNYYQHPTRDLTYKTVQEQMVLDTKVVCIECQTAFLPALIISDGTPRNEHQMICRSQTVREVTVKMRAEFKLEVMYMKESNIIIQPETGFKAWRNDVPAKYLKKSPGLFSNFLQYTPAPLMLDFISGKNLELQEPIYGVWQQPDRIRYNWF